MSLNDKKLRKDKGWQPLVSTNTLEPSQAGGADVALRMQSGELTVGGLLDIADDAYSTIDKFVTFPDEAQRLKIAEINAERDRLNAEANLARYKAGEAPVSAPVPAPAQDNTLTIAALGGLVLVGIGLVVFLSKKG